MNEIMICCPGEEKHTSHGRVVLSEVGLEQGLELGYRIRSFEPRLVAVAPDDCSCMTGMLVCGCENPQMPLEIWQGLAEIGTFSGEKRFPLQKFSRAMDCFERIKNSGNDRVALITRTCFSAYLIAVANKESITRVRPIGSGLSLVVKV